VWIVQYLQWVQYGLIEVAMWAALLADLIASYGGTQKDFAVAVGISRAHLSHLLSGEAQYSSPSIELCLKIARVTHTPASRVLRAAGKDATADLIESLYGGPAAVRTVDPAITLADRRFLLELSTLDRRSSRAIRYLVSRLSGIPK
jgi:transcriptional regulator with XRE-family HTH domain